MLPLALNAIRGACRGIPSILGIYGAADISLIPVTDPIRFSLPISPSSEPTNRLVCTGVEPIC